MTKKIQIILLIVSAVLFATIAQAQENKRQRIGLVLSGGGARGFAHIGVLQVMEEMKIPVDFIVGTSAGAIVGGLYADGMSPNDMQRFVCDLDWYDIFEDSIPREDQPYRDKELERNYVFNFNVDFKKGFTLPKGLLAGKKLEFILKALTLDATDKKSFLDLRIPFKAAAADLGTGELFEMNKGSLATAMRASMSIPPLFTPVEMDGKLLVDGGLASNVPVRMAKEMGPAGLIVINVSTPIQQGKDITNFLKVTNQLVGLLTNRTVSFDKSLLTNDDFLITPDMENITTGDFNKDSAAKAVEIGRKAAESAAGYLKRFSVSDNEYNEFLKKQRRPQGPIKLDFIELDDNNKFWKPQRSVRRIVQKAINSIYGDETNKIDVSKISSIGPYKDIDLKLVERDGKNGLLLETRDKLQEPDVLRIGYDFTDDFKGDSIYDVYLGYTMNGINSFGADWNTGLQMGNTMKASTEFYQPLDPYIWNLFVAPHVSYQNNYNYYMYNNQKLLRYRKGDFTCGADLGMQLGQYGEIRGGIKRGAYYLKSDVGWLEPDEDREGQGAFVIKFALDTLDSINFPTEGGALRFNAEFQKPSLGASEEYQLYHITFMKPFTFGNHTIMPLIRWGTTSGEADPFLSNHFLGGLLNLSGMSTNQMNDQHLAFGEIIYYYRFYRLPKPLGEGLFAGCSVEAGNVKDEYPRLNRDWLIFAGSIFVGADTLIGPIYLGIGHTDTQNSAIYLKTGHMF